jgi:quercetin dioxygenase-like cupin family protein
VGEESNRDLVPNHYRHTTEFDLCVSVVPFLSSFQPQGESRNRLVTGRVVGKPETEIGLVANFRVARHPLIMLSSGLCLKSLYSAFAGIDSCDCGEQACAQEQREAHMKLIAIETVGAMLLAVCISQAQSTQAVSTSPSELGGKPLLLERNEGEQRLWRPEPGEVDPGGFILKVTPKSNGSQHLVLVTEDMPPGAAIPTHKHLEQDEVVLIEKGTIHAHVGDQERDLHAGGMVFIPAHTWVSLKNIGTETASIVAIFSAPGFEDHLRCESVPANEKPTTISQAEENACDHLGHAVYRERGEKDSDSGTTPESGAKPLMLEKNEGERRLWRPEPGEVDPGGFILKVSRKNNGSQHLVLFTGEMVPGDAIPTHKHLGQDEILLIERGTVHVHLGDQERDLHAGGIVFIPAYTWVGAKNIGSERESDVAIFSAPGFEDHLRCESVPANEKPTTISQAEENACDRLGQVVYKDRGEEDPKK